MACHLLGLQISIAVIQIRVPLDACSYTQGSVKCGGCWLSLYLGVDPLIEWIYYLLNENITDTQTDKSCFRIYNINMNVEISKYVYQESCYRSTVPFSIIQLSFCQIYFSLYNISADCKICLSAKCYTLKGLFLAYLYR